MADSKPRIERPLSPHLQIFRPTLTMTMSIVHRITGGALYFGTIILAAWLRRRCGQPARLRAGAMVARHRSSAGSILFGYTWALLHHMLGGMKHLVWDTGCGFGPEAREQHARSGR